MAGFKYQKEILLTLLTCQNIYLSLEKFWGKNCSSTKLCKSPLTESQSIKQTYCSSYLNSFPCLNQCVGRLIESKILYFGP